MNNTISKGTVVTGRVRLARNLLGYNFASQLTDRTKAREIINRTYSVISRFTDFHLYEMSKTPTIVCEQLKERYLISEALKNNLFSGAVAVDKKEIFSIMINEEDHIRSQCLIKGADLFGAYKKLAPLDRWMDSNLRFAKSERLGYITACPTNLGTGLRASVMMYLPALTRKNMIGILYEKAKERGLTIRGVFGEGSGSESCLYQVSNEVTLSRSESSIIETVENYVTEVASIEELNKVTYYNENRIKIEDEVMRAYGILSNCKLLSYDEFSRLISSLKLGAMLGIIKVKDITALDDLLVTVRPASLLLSLGKKAESGDNGLIDQFRAKYTGECLEKIII